MHSCQTAVSPKIGGRAFLGNAPLHRQLSGPRLFATSRLVLLRSTFRSRLSVNANQRAEETVEEQPKGLFGFTRKISVSAPDETSKDNKTLSGRGTRNVRQGQSRSGTQFGSLTQAIRLPGRRDPNTVFVAGATGRLGARIVRELLQNKRVRVRAGARNAEKGRQFVQSAVQYGLLTPDAAKRVTVVPVDLEDEATIRPAIGNAGKIVQAIGAAETNLFDTGAPKRVDGDAAIRLVEVAKELNVQQYVMVTSLGTGKFGWPAGALNLFWGVLLQKKRAENALEASGIPYTIVRPGGMERPGDDYERTHNVRLEVRDKLFGGQVSRLQVAKLIAEAVNQPELAENKVLEVVAETGAPLLSYADLLSDHPADGEDKAQPAQQVAEAVAAIKQTAKQPAKQVAAAGKQAVSQPGKQARGVAAQAAKAAPTATKKVAARAKPLVQDAADTAQVAAEEVKSAARRNKSPFANLFGAGNKAKKAAGKPAEAAEQAKDKAVSAASRAGSAVEETASNAVDAAQAEFDRIRRENARKNAERVAEQRREQAVLAKQREADEAKAAEKRKAEEQKRKAEQARKQEVEAKQKAAADTKAKADKEKADQQKQKAAAEAKAKADKEKAEQQKQQEDKPKAKQPAPATQKQHPFSYAQTDSKDSKSGSATAGAASSNEKLPNAVEAAKWIGEWRNGGTTAAGSAISSAKPAQSQSQPQQQQQPQEQQKQAAQWRHPVNAPQKQEGQNGGLFGWLKLPWQSDDQQQQQQQPQQQQQQATAAAPAPAKAPSTSSSNANAPENVQEAREWIRSWRVRTLEAKLPQEVKANRD